MRDFNLNDKVLATIMATFLLSTTIIAGSIFADKEKDNDDNNDVSLIPPVKNSTQILVTDNIASTFYTGGYNDPDYVAEYSVRDLFDNLTNTFSYWSQKGPSSFETTFQNPLDKPLCKVQVDAYNPQNQKYILRVADSNNNIILDFNGILDVNPEIVQVDTCLKDVKKIGMQFTPTIFTPPTGNWTILSELKLFTDKPGPVEPPMCGPNEYYDPIKKICILIGDPDNISFFILNGTADMNVEDSKVILNIDKDTEIIENVTDTNDDNDNDEEEDDDN